MVLQLEYQWHLPCEFELLIISPPDDIPEVYILPNHFLPLRSDTKKMIQIFHHPFHNLYRGQKLTSVFDRSRL